MRLPKEVGVIHLLVQTVSQLINSQVRGEFQKKDPSLVRYLQKALKMSQTFVEFEVNQIPIGECHSRPLIPVSEHQRFRFKQDGNSRDLRSTEYRG